MSTFTRRSFLSGVTAGSLVLAARLSGSPMVARVLPGAALAFEPDLFLSIDGEGLVTIVAHRSEMGTGIRTSLPMVVADELGADWDRVRIEQAGSDPRLGSQNTDGSRSVRRFYRRMQVAGATARTMLERAAADRWGVDAEDCVARGHVVENLADGGELDFAELVEAAAALEVPAEDELVFKPRSEYRYVGKDVPIADLDRILRGTATFGMDARREGQLYAVVARSPVLGGRPKSVDKSAAEDVAGVREVIELPFVDPPYAFNAIGGIAVLADNTWSAIRGRSALRIEWEPGANASFDSAAFEQQLAATASEPGKAFRTDGDPDAVFAAASDDEVIEADYYVPLLSHAPMEPPCALAEVETDEDGTVTACEVWAPTQNPQAVSGTVAQALGIPPTAVRVNVTLLGGGFGRKSKPDYVVEAALLAKETGRPVHVTWTREDDIRHDYYHTVGAVHVQAVTGAGGKPKAWLQRSAFPPISTTFDPSATSGGAGELGMGLTDIPYDLPNIKVENGPAEAHVRIGWFRSVAHIYHAFAVCSFADELAHAAGRDPLEYLLELLGEPRELKFPGLEASNGGESLESYPVDVGRLRHVTERAAALAGWGKELPKGRGMGISCHRSFLSYCANVIEVDVSKDGVLSIPRVHVVIDAGTIIHPERVRSQMEGAASFSTSLAVHGEITARKGRVVQSNFHDYPMARMADSPREVHVEIVESEAPPSGVGEVGVPPFAPALCNAVFAATGKRIRRLPIGKHDLSWS